jgi:superfamily II DNA/RNA helicase
MLLDIALDRGLRLGLEALEFAEPTEVQKAVIPAALKGQDLLVSAQTGSGKTLAYLIPGAQRVLGLRKLPESGTLVLVLVPTRELARQVQKDFASLCARTPLQAGLITGGNSFRYQQSILRKNPEFIISTPGRLVELLTDGSADLSSLQTLILDEADRMLDMGLKEEVLDIIAACNSQCQILMVSATLQHAGVGRIAKKLLSDACEVTVGVERSVHHHIHQQVILCDGPSHRRKLLTWLLKQNSYNRVLVFSNTRIQADQLCGYLQHQQFRAGVLHGELSQDERNHVMGLFRQGKVNILVASDVAARGLDVKEIDVVINFDMPRTAQDYIHRVGRTGRAGRQGTGISFVSAGDWNVMVSIERFLGTTFERRVIDSLRAKFKGKQRHEFKDKAADSNKSKALSKNNKSKPQREVRIIDKHGAGTDKKRGGERTSGGTVKSGTGFGPLMKKSRK